MELKISSPKLGGLSPSDCNSDPEEKEVSDDDDDDRNHKHRRRDTRSQSLERDTLDQALTRPFRKRNNKPFLNGNHFRENDSQASTPWKNFNSNPFEKDFSGKFDKRQPGHASINRLPLDVNQRIRLNHSFSGDPILGRGRGRDLGSRNQRDPRFSSDIASQVVQGSITPSLFAGRGLLNVSNAQINASWNAFGLTPGLPNGGLDGIHPIGLPGTLRPPLPSSLSMGIPRQRCRDFEERGFCLRGDMCPMEHGVNRIVIEDVQSLSQFNLPVSLPSAHVLGTTGGPGPGSLAAISSSSLTSMNSKGPQSKTSKSGFPDDGLGLNGSYSGSSYVAGADLYDPDQPLWNNNGPETSNTLLALNSTKIDETESLMNGDPSDNEFSLRSTGNAVGSHSTSVWGRIGSSKSRLDVKEKVDPAISSSDYIESDSKVDKVASEGILNSSRQGKQIIAEDAGPKLLDSSGKAQFDTMHNNRKPSQKALRTLFVNGIPLKNNKKEALLSHFQKFGEVIDIYIPMNTERAFVQFSKKEEAEAALKAPDAVMANRFIRLFWANRDSIPDDHISSSSSVRATTHGAAAVLVSTHSSLASSNKDNLQAAAPKSSTPHTQDASLPASDNSKPDNMNGSKVVPPLQKKLDSLEQLKEELRKKQEMLEQKRNDFRRKLDKLEKQTTGSKDESDTEQPAKRPKVGIAVDVAKASTPSSSDASPVVISPNAGKTPDKNKSGEKPVSHSPKTNTTVVLPESISSKQHPVRPFAPVGSPFMVNRFKLDNRPTAFKILPPLPAGFTNVAVVREHFLQYGDISNVELEHVEACDGSSETEASKDCSTRVNFVTRRSAERAFINGKSWQGHNLKFTWLAPSTPSNDPIGRENSPSTSKGSSDADVKRGEKPASVVSQEVASSGSGEPKNEEKGITEDVELGEETEQSPSPTSGKEESTRDDKF
ncbi:hypothetical protein TIFTF001_011764 [Ficus carica]|uniref:Zinc finger CCCH domain-containing protein 41 n=1 Tax=Ficus carica TaxID=3494 RepID=A0AA87ZZA5_FICCA|nr:hypothetical protein TIFTF001_011764 [Ficus carica]